MKKIICIAFILILFFTGTSIFSEESSQYSEVQYKLAGLGFEIPNQSFPAPDFTLKNPEGEDIKLSDLQGKVVFLNFWATWCPPCRAEMPSMEKIYAHYKDKDFTILAVNLQEKSAQVKDFIKKNKYSFPVVLDTDGRVGGGMYMVQGIPTTYLVDKDGGILARLVGTREWDTEEVLAVFDELIE